MKIVSKKKDYYDYLIGIYGIDPLRTFVRDNTFEYKITEPHYYDMSKYKGTILTFHIGGTSYCCLEYFGRYIYDPVEIREIRNDGKHLWRNDPIYTPRESKVNDVPK